MTTNMTNLLGSTILSSNTNSTNPILKNQPAKNQPANTQKDASGKSILTPIMPSNVQNAFINCSVGSGSTRWAPDGQGNFRPVDPNSPESKSPENGEETGSNRGGNGKGINNYSLKKVGSFGLNYKG